MGRVLEWEVLAGCRNELASWLVSSFSGVFLWSTCTRNIIKLSKIINCNRNYVVYVRVVCPWDMLGRDIAHRNQLTLTSSGGGACNLGGTALGG